MEYQFEPTPVRYPIREFVDQMFYHLRNGLSCEHYHEIKEKELFILLRAYYEKIEVAKLLYPILGEPDFKSFILQNYIQVDNISELSQRAGMSRTVFDNKFRNEFHLSPKQWLLKQTANHIRYRAMDPKVTITDLMDEFKFNSATHFNRFCKQQFNCTPKELITRQRVIEKENE